MTINGVGHFVQDGGAEQLSAAMIAFVEQTPLSAIQGLSASRCLEPGEQDDAAREKRLAEKIATEKADMHGSDSPWSSMATPWDDH